MPFPLEASWSLSQMILTDGIGASKFKVKINLTHEIVLHA